MQKWQKEATKAMTNPMRFAIPTGCLAVVAISGYLFLNRESDTSTFERAMSRMAGLWSGTAQMFLPDGKSPILQGSCKFDGKAREYRFVADFVADEATRQAIDPQNQNSNLSITKFLRLTPKGSYTLDETPIEFDNLSGFAAGQTSNLRLVSNNPDSCEVVEFRSTSSTLEISVATGKSRSSVKPNVVFRLNKVQA